LGVGVLPERRQSVDFVAVLVATNTRRLSVADVLVLHDFGDGALGEGERPVLLHQVADADVNGAADYVHLLSH